MQRPMRQPQRIARHPHRTAPRCTATEETVQRCGRPVGPASARSAGRLHGCRTPRASCRLLHGCRISPSVRCRAGCVGARLHESAIGRGAAACGHGCRSHCRSDVACCMPRAAWRRSSMARARLRPCRVPRGALYAACHLARCTARATWHVVCCAQTWHDAMLRAAWDVDAC
jgi:hypothetical protein